MKGGGTFLYDTINRNPVSRFATITVAEDILRLLPKGSHDPSLFIRPKELEGVMTQSGLMVGPTTGLGPRGVNLKGDLVFGPLPIRTIIFMGVATKPESLGD